MIRDGRRGYPRFENGKYIHAWVEILTKAVIISIRPEDQDLFMRLLNVRIKEDLPGAAPSVLERPPA